MTMLGISTQKINKQFYCIFAEHATHNRHKHIMSNLAFLHKAHCSKDIPIWLIYSPIQRCKCNWFYKILIKLIERTSIYINILPICLYILAPSFLKGEIKLKVLLRYHKKASLNIISEATHTTLSLSSPNEIPFLHAREAKRRLSLGKFPPYHTSAHLTLPKPSSQTRRRIEDC